MLDRGSSNGGPRPPGAPQRYGRGAEKDPQLGSESTQFIYVLITVPASCLTPSHSDDQDEDTRLLKSMGISIRG